MSVLPTFASVPMFPRLTESVTLKLLPMQAANAMSLVREVDKHVAMVHGVRWTEGGECSIELGPVPPFDSAAQPVDSVRGWLPLLTNEQRLALFAELTEGYCKSCGREVIGICHCENDE